MQHTNKSPIFVCIVVLLEIFMKTYNQDNGAQSKDCYGITGLHLPTIPSCSQPWKSIPSTYSFFHASTFILLCILTIKNTSHRDYLHTLHNQENRFCPTELLDSLLQHLNLYIGYNIGINESNLSDKYIENETILMNPTTIVNQGWSTTKEIYLESEDVCIDLPRFKNTVMDAKRRAIRFIRKQYRKGHEDDRAFKSSKSKCNQWEIIFEVLWVTSIIFKEEAHDYNQVIQKSIIIIITK